MALDNFGDVKLGSHRLSVNIDSYKKATVSDFSPKVSTASGSAFSELDLFQQMSQRTWNHGFGFIRFTDEAGYMRTTGMVDTRHAGLSMLFTTPRLKKTSTDRLKGFLRFHTLMFAWGPDDSYYSSDNGDNWASSGLTETITTAEGDKAITAVATAWTNGIYVFACIENGRVYRSTDLTTWTATGVGAAAKSYRWSAIHNGYTYVGKQYEDDIEYNDTWTFAGSPDYSMGVQVHFDGTEDLSDLHGDEAADTNVLYVGERGGKAVGGLSFAGNLMVFRTDGLYQLNAGNDGFTRILPFEDVVDDNNFQSVVVHNGYLVFSIENKIYQWNGSRLSNITPRRLNDQFPYTTYGYFRHFVVANGYLYCVGRTNETAYDETLLCFDGVSWVKLLDFQHTAADCNDHGVTAMWYDASTNQMWVCLETDSSPVEYQWKVIKLQDKSDYPYADYLVGTSVEHAMITSYIDSGYPLIRKVSPTLIIDTENLTANRYILVYYRLNENTAWKAWGGTDGTTNKLISSGYNTLDNPRKSSKGKSVLVYSKIQLKFVFVTDDAAQTPVLRGYSLRVLMRPESYYGWSFAVKAELGIQGGRSTRLLLDPKQVVDHIEELRDSGAPVDFTDIWGTQYPVYITSVSEIPLKADSSRIKNSPHYIQVNLVEVTNFDAVYIHESDWATPPSWISGTYNG